MDYEKAYKKLKEFCETLYDGVYCDDCGRSDDESLQHQCEDCHRKMMMWVFPKKIINNIENDTK